VSRLYSIARKLWLIAQSDLAGIDKLRYVLNPAGQGAGLAAYRLRGGVNRVFTTIVLRKGTTDFKVFDEIFVERAYAPCVAALPRNLGRVALIDLGANIGLSALYIAHELGARALQVDQIIAVEPDPDNFRLLSENLRRSGLANRSIAVRAFAGADRACAELHDSGNGAWGMRMGALSDAGIPVLPLAEIANSAKTRSAKTEAPLVLKCDIEGGERQLFLHIRDWDHLIRYIILELHTEFLSVEEMFACLRSSGFEWTIHGTPLPGASMVLFMLERGVRKA
jgi:FkbM family methyltransferase